MEVTQNHCNMFKIDMHTFFITNLELLCILNYTNVKILTIIIQLLELLATNMRMYGRIIAEKNRL